MTGSDTTAVPPARPRGGLDDRQHPLPAAEGITGDRGLARCRRRPILPRATGRVTIAISVPCASRTGPLPPDSSCSPSVPSDRPGHPQPAPP